jgi:hypothetical protein
MNYDIHIKGDGEREGERRGGLMQGNISLHLGTKP